MAETAEEARPLTDEEKKVLRDLLSRENTFAAPANRVGDPYEALTNLSVPRRSNTKEDRQSDLVMRGETVYLTEEEAARFNRMGARDGRQVEVVRKLSGPDGSREPLPRLLPRQVSGKLFRPLMPPPGSDAARPDPQGSSRLEYIAEEGNAPEASGSVAADPAEMADQFKASVTSPDAVDIPPSQARRGRSRS